MARNGIDDGLRKRLRVFDILKVDHALEQLSDLVPETVPRGSEVSPLHPLVVPAAVMSGNILT